MQKKILLSILRLFSKKIIEKYKPEVVGITGSIGKSSAKEAIAAVLSKRFKVRKNFKNYNNEIGLPLTIIGMEKSPGKSLFGWIGVFLFALKELLTTDKDYPQMLVLEMGSDKPGDIEYLVGIAPCKVGVLTYISHVHTEFFKTLKKISQEKRVIISRLPTNGFAVLNYDNQTVMENAEITKAKVVTYGFKEGADVHATAVNVMTDGKTGWPVGLNFKVTYQGSTVPVFLGGMVARPAVVAALAGLAVGATYGINLVEAADALRTVHPLPGHMCLIPGIKNTLIIDDTYNSSPEPVRAALQTLAEINLQVGAERYAVLADMLELGGETENAHREIGMRVAELGIDFLITVGEASKQTATAAREAGMEEHRVACFADSVSAGKFLQEKLKAGDVALVKGSQSMRMEKIVKEVMAEPMLAGDLLVRQGVEWK